MNYRAMDPDLAVAQISELFKHHDKAQRLQCVDNILPKSYIKDVLPKLQTPETFSIFYEVKADLDEEAFEALRDSRVLAIQPGIESLSTSTLKLMKKGTSALKNVTFLTHCVTYGISPIWNRFLRALNHGCWRKFLWNTDYTLVTATQNHELR